MKVSSKVKYVYQMGRRSNGVARYRDNGFIYVISDSMRNEYGWRSRHTDIMVIR